MKSQAVRPWTGLGIGCLLLLAAMPGMAQFESGSLYGTATTTNGEELAEVQVTLSGIGPDRHEISDSRSRHPIPKPVQGQK